MKKPTNHGQPWTPAANKQLQQLASGNTPTRVIGLKMGRTPGAVASHASLLGVWLKPKKQRPNGKKNN